MRASIFFAALAGNVLVLAAASAPAVALIRHPSRAAATRATVTRLASDAERVEREATREPDAIEIETETETASGEEPAPAPAPAPAAVRKPPPPRAPSPAAAAVPALDPKELEHALAARIDELPMCRRGGGPEGPGAAEVLFLPEGRALVKLSEPYAATSSGACIARRLSSAARPFDGAPVALRVRFSL